MGKGKSSISLRCFLALLIGKLVAWGCHLFGRSATSLPGVVAMRVCPGLVGSLIPAYERVLAVTGTNGKTTTSNLLAHFLRAGGYSVAHNAEGANMLPGIATALIRDTTLAGNNRSRIALLEVDEGSVGKVFPQARPELVVVTNYFRDQLDRYWELERTIKLLKEELDKLPSVKLLLNADDPLVAAIGVGREQVGYYGVEKYGESQTGGTVSHNSEDSFWRDWSEHGSNAAIGSITEAREGRFCSFCGHELSYSNYYFGQLGNYRCPQCGFRRPQLHLAATGMDASGELAFTLQVNYQTLIDAHMDQNHNRIIEGSNPDQTPVGAEAKIHAPLRGFYNTYNILAAAAAALELGVPLERIARAIMAYTPATGRMEEFLLNGRHCTLALIKNPAGVNVVLKTILEGAGDKSVVVAINDLAADGRDVSWLWDADFAKLNHPSVHKIICSGRRAADIATCLKYAGIPTERLLLEPQRRQSLELLDGQPGKEYYILATYTNLFAYAGLLRKLGKVVERHAPEGVSSLS